jgi:hypothetical protein
MSIHNDGYMNTARTVRRIKGKFCCSASFKKEEVPNTVVVYGLCVTEFKKD